MKTKMNRIAVFCGSSIGFKPVYKLAAERLGRYFVQNNIGLVYGGGKVGLMGSIANKIMQQNGEVLGVIPNLLRKEEVAHTNITKLITTKNMSTRKVEISKLVDGYIALAGGFGTLDEIFEALTLNQLGIEHKPIGLLNTNQFYNPILNQLDHMVAEGFLKPDNRNMLLVSESVEGLMTKMLDYQPIKTGEITSKIASK